MSAVALSSRYAQRKGKLKRDIQVNCEQWVSIGEQLRVIKESGDWKQDCESWAEFCRKCCTFTKRFADQLIADARSWIPLREMLSGMGSDFPLITQSAVHEIARIESPSERLEIVQEVVKASPRPTARNIKAAVAKRARAIVIDGATGEPEPAPKKLCPHCGKEL